MELTNRQIHLLIASLEGSMKRMSPGCPMEDEVEELYDILMVEAMAKNWDKS